MRKTALFVFRRKSNFFHEGSGIAPNAPPNCATARHMKKITITITMSIRIKIEICKQKAKSIIGYFKSNCQ